MFSPRCLVKRGLHAAVQKITSYESWGLFNPLLDWILKSVKLPKWCTGNEESFSPCLSLQLHSAALLNKLY